MGGWQGSFLMPLGRAATTGKVLSSILLARYQSQEAATAVHTDPESQHSGTFGPTGSLRLELSGDFPSPLRELKEVKSPKEQLQFCNQSRRSAPRQGWGGGRAGGQLGVRRRRKQGLAQLGSRESDIHLFQNLRFPASSEMSTGDKHRPGVGAVTPLGKSHSFSGGHTRDWLPDLRGERRRWHISEGLAWVGT